uniref:Uncharacterized protein n=1 Tax=Anopheles farauti TaxID=69004 RepID=A0A182QP06_9DIPT
MPSMPTPASPRSADADESLPDDCTELRLPFSAVLHRPFGRSERLGVCCPPGGPVILLVRFGTSGGTFRPLALDVLPLLPPELPMPMPRGRIWVGLWLQEVIGTGAGDAAPDWLRGIGLESSRRSRSDIERAGVTRWCSVPGGVAEMLRREETKAVNTLLSDHRTILGRVDLTVLQGRLKVWMWMWMVHHVHLALLLLLLLLLLLHPTAHAFLRLCHRRDRGELLHHRVVAEGALNRQGRVPCLHSTVLALQQFDLLVQQILRQREVERDLAALVSRASAGALGWFDSGGSSTGGVGGWSEGNRVYCCDRNAITGEVTEPGVPAASKPSSRHLQQHEHTQSHDRLSSLSLAPVVGAVLSTEPMSTPIPLSALPSFGDDAKRSSSSFWYIVVADDSTKTMGLIQLTAEWNRNNERYGPWLFPAATITTTTNTNTNAGRSRSNRNL